MRSKVVVSVVCLLAGLLIWLALPAGASAAACPWVTSRAPVAQRVAQLTAAMSLVQKLDLIGGSGTGAYTGETTAVPSLCIPMLSLEDGPAGVGDSLKGVTQLPAPIDLAAAWNTGLAFQYGSVVGAEDRSKGVDVNLGPTVNVVRDPRWGRAFETYGEDPYLTGAVGDGYIEGVQSTGVMAQVKHLVAYDEETGRDNPLTSDSIVSQRALQEIYLPPFQDAVQRAHVASAMCSYNAINGVPGCQNAYAMTQVLDEQFGFTGFITSDWYALQGAALSINAGTDMEMPDGCYFSTGMMQALANGSVSMATLNGMVDRILTEMFDYHLIGAQPTGKSTNFATSLAHETSALKIAEAGTVLLKNAGGLLPLARASVGSVAVIGNDATDPVTGGSGSASVIPEKTITPLAGIRQLVGSGAQVTYSAGSNIHGAAAAAAKAKVAVVFVDLADGEEDDVSSIALSGNQNSLIAAVAAANPHTVVVINSGDAVLMPWINQVAGVIEAWYPGEQDGSAIANILFGDYDPSGRLPVTFPQSESQLSATSWPSLIGGQHFNEGIDVGYRYFETAHETPLFPFGYGLSYTSFKLSKPTIPARTSNGHALVHVTVQNSGPRSGADVVELYVGEPSAAGEPPAQLKGFDSVQLAPGQKRVVTFRLVPRDLSYWSGRWAAMAGAYQVYIGTSATSLPIHLSTTLTRNLITSPPPGPAPAVSGHDSPLLAAECPVDSLGPLVNTTISTGVVSLLADLP